MTTGCEGPREIALMVAQWGIWVEGKFEEMLDRTGSRDRQVTLIRDCGHGYQWGGSMDTPPPQAGEPAMACLGPQAGEFVRPPEQQPGLSYQDPRKRPTKRRLPRKGE